MATQAEEAMAMMSCVRCGRYSGPEILCARCDADVLDGIADATSDAYDPRTDDPTDTTPDMSEEDFPDDLPF